MGRNNRRSKQTTVAPDSTSSPSPSPSSVDSDRVRYLELENQAIKKENEELKGKLANVSFDSIDSSKKPKENNLQKLIFLEEQVLALKKKVAVQSQFSSRKQNADEGVKRLHDEIQSLKAQKVQLQCKLKIDSVEFRLYKASLEKQVLQVKKDARRNEHEMHKLLALNQRQKKVLQRKTEEASWATKRLKDLLEFRKALSRRTPGVRNSNDSVAQDIERELEVTEQIREVCAEYEHQIEEMLEEVANLKEDVENLKQENFRLQLQDKEVECAIKNSELLELKTRVVELANLVRRVDPKTLQVDRGEKSQAKLGHSLVNRAKLSQSPVHSERGTQIIKDIITSEPEHSSEGNASLRKTTLGLCCSCSKNSSCKTNKCKCRATKGSCGPLCGCAAFKCTNRGAVSTKLDAIPQLEMGENIVDSSGSVKMEKSEEIVSKGAMLLQTALAEKLVKKKNNCETRKKPLCDIGNILRDSSGKKPRQRKKGKKPVIQLVTAAPASSQLEKLDAQ